MEPILQIEHLTHTYSAGTPFQRSAVEDMNLSVMDGEFLGIIGTCSLILTRILT